MHYKKKNKGKGKATTANTIASCAAAVVEGDEDDNVGPSTRPAERKQVKTSEAVKRKRSEQRDTIEDAMAAKLQVEMAIMEKDPADIADPIRRRWLENAQRLIMEQVEVLPAEEVEDNHDDPEAA
ncbi:unnamed protein product [Rhizopus stolonifer]